MGTSIEELKKNLSPDTLALNADLFGVAQAGALGGAIESLPASTLAAQFEGLWRRWEGPALQREVEVVRGRRWRVDYWHEATRTAIELEGGLYSNAQGDGKPGRHLRPKGYQDDCEKYNAMQMRGIVVLRLATGQVDDAHVVEFIDYINRRMKK